MYTYRNICHMYIRCRDFRAPVSFALQVWHGATFHQGESRLPHECGVASLGRKRKKIAKEPLGDCERWTDLMWGPWDLSFVVLHFSEPWSLFVLPRGTWQTKRRSQISPMRTDQLCQVSLHKQGYLLCMPSDPILARHSFDKQRLKRKTTQALIQN